MKSSMVIIIGSGQSQLVSSNKQSQAIKSNEPHQTNTTVNTTKEKTQHAHHDVLVNRSRRYRKAKQQSS
jgi:purine nucleoside phosphorylase